MAEDYSVSCDGVALSANGVLYSIVVYTDGEGYNSYVYRDSDVAEESGPNVQTELLDVQLWLTDIWLSETGTLFVSDADGSVHRYDGAEWVITSVSPRAITTLWGFSDEEIYAGGREGIVYRFDGTIWSPISAPLGETLFSIRGSSSRNLYVCGEAALLWHYDGGEWISIVLPTNRGLVDLLLVTPNDVLACGPSGVLFRGAGTEWADVSQSGHDLHALALYRGLIYVAGADEGIFTFDGTALTNVKDTLTAYSLVARGDYLAAAGDTLAVRFDGVDWFGPEYS